jgi:hypothetical protein
MITAFPPPVYEYLWMRSHHDRPVFLGSQSAPPPFGMPIAGAKVHPRGQGTFALASQAFLRIYE